jgi:hypothetical protein
MLGKIEFAPKSTTTPTEIQPTNLPLGSLHPTWAAALEPAETSPLQIWLKQGMLTGQPMPTGVPAWAQTTAIPAGVVLPLSVSDLLDKNRLAARLGQLGGTLNNPAVPRLGGQVCTELSAEINDVIKLQHPEWHSGADELLGGLAIGASSFEMWRALQDRDRTQILLTGAQLGTNVVDLAASATEALGSAEPTIHGVCFLFRAAAGIAKICVALKRDKGTSVSS